MAKKTSEENPVFELEFFRRQGAIGGAKGGGLSWKKLTKEERSARARESSRKRPSVIAKAARLAKAAKKAARKKAARKKPAK